MNRSCTALLQSDTDGGGYTVTVPAMPGVVTQGTTVEQCLERVQEAIALHLAEALAEAGEPISEEHEKPLLLTVTAAW
jgi:antitoxin HicB